MSLLDSISDFATGTYTVTRTPAGTWTVGRYAPGSATTFTIQAVVEPYGGRQVQVPPEGQHAEDVRIVYTSTELRTMSPLDVPDLITIDGESYSVFRIDGPWVMPDSTHYRVFVARQRIP